MEKETHIVLVLDSSSSMYSIQNSIVRGFNGELDEIKASADKGGQTYVSLVVFGENNDSVVTKFAHKKADALVKLDSNSYRPSGSTPMRDGIGRAIELVEPYDQPWKEDVSFLICIFTDGMENTSSKWSAQKLADKVKALQLKENWTFTFSGANVDLQKIHQMTNIPVSNMMGYATNDAAVAGMMHTNSLSTANFLGNRAGGMRGMSAGGFYETSPVDVGQMNPARAQEKYRQQLEKYTGTKWIIENGKLVELVDENPTP